MNVLASHRRAIGAPFLIGIPTGAVVAGYWLGGRCIKTAMITGAATLSVMFSYLIFKVQKTKRRLAPKVDQIMAAQVEQLPLLKFKKTESGPRMSRLECEELCNYIESNREERVREALTKNASILLSSKKYSIPRSLLFYLEEEGKESGATRGVRVFVLLTKGRDGYYDKGTFKTVKRVFDYDDPTKPYATFTALDPAERDPENYLAVWKMPLATKELNGFRMVKGREGFLQLIAHSGYYDATAKPSNPQKRVDGKRTRFIVDFHRKGSLFWQLKLINPERKMGIVKQLIDIVVRAHKDNILLRGIKSQNILLDDRDKPRLCDFSTLCHATERNVRKELVGSIVLLH